MSKEIGVEKLNEESLDEVIGGGCVDVMGLRKGDGDKVATGELSNFQNPFKADGSSEPSPQKESLLGFVSRPKPKET